MRSSGPRPSPGCPIPCPGAEREIDSQLLRSRELGFRNSHVPVANWIISAIAVLAATLDGLDEPRGHVQRMVGVSPRPWN